MKNNRVLVVEDDNTLLLAYTSALAKEGLETISATNSEEALAQFNKNDVNAIIMDFMLPSIHGLNGIEILKQIRATAKGRDLPAFMVTNMDDENLKDEAKKVKAEYILKVTSSLTDLCMRLKTALFIP